MLISFYRSNQAGPLFFTPLLIGIFWISGFLNPIIIPDQGMPVHQFFLNSFMKFDPLVSAIFSFILVSFQAIYFNHILNKYEVFPKKTNLPLIIYALISVASPEFLAFSPLLFVNVLLLIVTDNLFSLYKNNSPLPLIFNLGTLISIATLFYFPSIVLIFLLLVSLLFLRPFVWREWIVGLMGFLCPYFYLILFSYLNNQTNYVEIFSTKELSLSISSTLIIDNITLWLIITLGLMLVVSLFKMQSSFYKNVIRTRRFLMVLLLFLINGIFFFPLAKTLHLRDFIIIIIPLSTFIANYFYSIRRKWISEVSFVILFGLVILNHLKNLF